MISEGDLVWPQLAVQYDFSLALDGKVIWWLSGPQKGPRGHGPWSPERFNGHFERFPKVQFLNQMWNFQNLDFDPTYPHFQ